MKKYLPLKIFKECGKDWSNDGLSSKYNTCYIECDEGFIDESRVPGDAIVKLEIGAFGTIHLVPTKPIPNGHVGYMMGGCFVSTSDSRWSRMIEKMGYRHCAIALHDRTESYEDYETLSR